MTKVKLLLGLLSLVFICQSCENEIEFSADNSAILDIVEDKSKMIVSYNSLPSHLMGQVEASFLPIEAVIISKSKHGIEIELSSGHNLYFTPEGESLNDTISVLLGRGRCLEGKEIVQIDKPIFDYIKLHYENVRILKASRNISQRSIGILLSNNIVVKFSLDGKFESECNVSKIDRNKILDLKETHLAPLNQIPIIDDCIEDQIERFHSRLKRAFQRKNKTIFVLLENNIKLVFDDQCKMIYDSSK